MRVMVAMSGGVDSSLAAALMLAQGHEVVGVTMKLRTASPNERANRGGSCCSPDDLHDARAVCDTLGIPHYVVDFQELFRQKVMEPFAAAYLAGRTPNPCVLCNDHIKFTPLLDRAQALGCERLVTGHYARLEQEADGRYALRRAFDRSKDQTYFLFGLPQITLSKIWFPLGGYTKAQVREMAAEYGLHTAGKADSEDICFVPDGDYVPVVERIVGPQAVPQGGQIVDTRGQIIGEHQGVHRYTVGQRKGLNIKIHNGPERLYVLDVDGPGGRVTVGPRADLAVTGLRAQGLRWWTEHPPARLTVCIRHRHPGVSATLLDWGAEHASVRFDAPLEGVAPGQAVVFYDGDRVVGGGWIAQPLRGQPEVAAGSAEVRNSPAQVSPDAP